VEAVAQSHFTDQVEIYLQTPPHSALQTITDRISPAARNIDDCTVCSCGMNAKSADYSRRYSKGNDFYDRDDTSVISTRDAGSSSTGSTKDRYFLPPFSDIISSIPKE
jgi:hypothetical protein